MTFKIQRYGWKPDHPDHRDLAYAAVHKVADVQLPEKVSLKDHMSLVFDQGSLGSCSSQSTLYAFQFVHGAPTNGDPYWSRMFLYTETLITEGSYPNDAGGQIRDVVKLLATKGICPESDFPYDVDRFPSKPPHKALSEARKTKLKTYSRLNGRDDYMNCLASGFPFVFGFSVFESFESPEVAKTGIVPMPAQSEGMVGGHAVCCIGYDTNFNNTGELYYLVQNSWGPSWGFPNLSGCFWMPATYLECDNLASDFWTLRNT